MPASSALKRQGWKEEERKEIYDYAHAYITAFFTSSGDDPGSPVPSSSSTSR